MKFIPKLGEGGIKGLLANHVEKMLLGVVGLGAVVLIFAGYNRTGPDRNKAPDDLQRAAESAKQHIATDTWPYVLTERYPEEDRFTQRAEEQVVDIKLADFSLPLPWDPLDFPLRAKRIDPELLAVQNLEVRSGYGALALRGEDGDGLGRDGRPKRAGGANLLLGAAAPDGAGGRPLPEERRAGLKGFRPAGGATAEGHYFVSITGLIPYREQVEQFDRAFLNSRGFDAARDRPRYIYYHVERAEVAADGSEEEWQTLHTKSAQTFAKQFAEGVEEIADPTYIDPAVALPVMPVMLRDYTTWAIHSKIPRRQFGTVPEGQVEPPPVQPVPDPDLPGGDDLPFGFEAAEAPAAVVPAPVAAEDVPAAQVPTALVEFKMFRFYDFKVEPGKSYRYRVRLLVEDPNDPENTSAAPSPRNLEKAVVDRIRAKPMLSRLKRRPWWRETAWSEPSGVATVPGDYRILAGQVTVPRLIPLRDGRKFDNPTDEIAGQIMVLKWDNAKALDVAGELEVYRGTLANFSETVEALRPVALALETVPDYPFQTNTMVLDLRGGQLMRGRDRKDVLTAPGEMLLIDAEGNLAVHREYEDSPTYQEFDFGKSPPADQKKLPEARESRATSGGKLLSDQRLNKSSTSRARSR